MPYNVKVIHIRAEDSPNVRYALEEKALGLTPSNRVLVPGVLTWEEFCRRRATWDLVRQTIGLDGEFYEGAELLLYPPEWLNEAHRMARELRGLTRQARAIGVDPAEGGDKTAMAAVDEYGLIELVSKPTPNTSVITSETIAFGKKHGVPPSKWFFDAGGGGKQHADRLHEQGFYGVRAVAFGAAPTPEPRRGMTSLDDRRDAVLERYSYLNRRAEMYYGFSHRLDPSVNKDVFAIPDQERGPVYGELRRQMSLIPKITDRDGRQRMLPKNRPSPNSKERTLRDLLGCSPDELDALVLAVWGMSVKTRRPVADVS